MAKPLWTNSYAKTLLPVVLPAVCIFLVTIGVNNVMAAIPVFDGLGRLTNPEETFRHNNPQPGGLEHAPIPEIDAYDMAGFPPLMRAVSAGNRPEVDNLLQRKANPNIRNVHGRTPLEAAADRGDLEIAALLVKHGAKAGLGYPLHYAETAEMKAFLKKHGATEAAPSQKHHVLATGFNDGRILEGILAEEETSGMPQPSIPVAVMLGRSQGEISSLLARGSDINEDHPAFGSALHQGIFQNHDTEFFAFLLRSGANPNLASAYGGRPLEEAVDAGREDLACLLLDFSAHFKDPDTKPEKTVFHKAVEKEMLELSRRMLASGADPNEYVRDAQGRPLYPPLFLTGSPAMLRLILASGADPKAEDQQGRNALGALDWKRDNSIPAALVLLEGGVSGTHASIYKKHHETLIHWALWANSHELFLAARKAGVSVTERDEKKNTPLLLAVRQGDAWFTRELLKAGAPVKGSALYPGQRYADYERSYAATDDLLAQAVQAGSLEVARLLLDAGVSLDVKANEYDQGTALHLAVAAKRMDMADALLKAGARTDVTDRYGRTPLYWAAERGNAELVALLLNAGADPKAKDSDGENPLDIAKERGHNPELIRLLQARL